MLPASHYIGLGDQRSKIFWGKKKLVLHQIKKENRKKKEVSITLSYGKIFASRTKCTYVCMSYATYVGTLKTPSRLNTSKRTHKPLDMFCSYNKPTVFESVTSKLNPITPRNEVARLRGCVTGVMICTVHVHVVRTILGQVRVTK